MSKSEAFGCFEGVFNGSNCDNELDDMLSILDFPLENLEGDDGLIEDWDVSKFQSIPSDFLMSPLAFSFSCRSPTKQSGEFTDISRNFKPIMSERIQERRMVQSQSPISVFETTIPPSTRKIRKGIRSKRSRPSHRDHPWFSFICPLFFNSRRNTCDIRKMSCKRTKDYCHQAVASIMSLEVKRCGHCQVTKTPQWREGPTGPRTLCNACGVRFRTGRLFPEYRPANSPTFVPSLHSNSHKKVIDMRNKAKQAKTLW